MPLSRDLNKTLAVQNEQRLHVDTSPVQPLLEAMVWGAAQPHSSLCRQRPSSNHLQIENL